MGRMIVGQDRVKKEARGTGVRIGRKLGVFRGVDIIKVRTARRDGAKLRSNWLHR